MEPNRKKINYAVEHLGVTEEQIDAWAKDWDNSIRVEDPEKWTNDCANCGKAINFNPYNGDSYSGCWCHRWWCCDEHAKLDGRKFIGDSYEVDHISCNHCRGAK